MRKKFIFYAGILFFFIFLGGCQEDERNQSDHVKKVKVAYAQSGKPMSWTDESGEATGYDVEVLKRIDEKLTDYEFEFIGTTDDDLLIGVEQGKYQVGIKNAFYTEERAKKYLYPKEFLGLSSIGLVVKTEDKELDTLEKFAKANKTLAPIAANNAQYTVIQEYNETHPDAPVHLQAGDTFSIDIVQWVNEGRVDGGIMIEGAFKENVTAEDAPYKKLEKDITYHEFDVIKTWPLFHKEEQKLADAYDKALLELKESRELNKLSEKFYGRDLFEVLDKVDR